MPRPCFIFDLDGTLVRFKLRVADAKREFLDYLYSLGLDVEGLDESLPTQEILRRISNGNYELFRKVMLEVDRIFGKYEFEAAKVSELRDGAREVIETLEDLNFGVVVATNNSRAAASITLKVVGLDWLIPRLITRDDIKEMKPSADILIRAAYMARTPINSCVYIGDSHVDVIAARRVGMLSVAITGGVASREKLEIYKPHYIIERLPQVLDLIPHEG